MAARAEWLDTDFYAVLGLAEDASASEITKAYRRLARDLHPDARPGDAAAEARFKEVAAAYDVLGDPNRRAGYDEMRRLARAGVTVGSGARSSRGPYRVRVQRRGGAAGDIDMDDRFGDIFGTGSGHPRHNVPRRADVELSLEQAVFGTTTTAADGTRVRIPAGVEDGQIIQASTPNGDLRVRVHVRRHPRFQRRGHDLAVTVHVTYPEAVLGAEVKVPTLDGAPVTVRVPPGTPSGRTFRVRGHGVPTGHGRRGDLLATVQIAVPRRVDGEELRLVEALAGVIRWDPRRDPAGTSAT